MDNPIAQELLGKKSATKWNLEKNPFQLQPRYWIIREIKSKYTHAFQEAMNTHSRRFPERGDLFVLTTPTDEVGEVDSEGLRQQMLSALPDESRRLTIEEHYRKGVLTIGSVANLLRRDLLATTIYFASTQDIGIYSSSGSQQEYDYGREQLLRAEGFVIDATSIIIMELLKVRDLLNEKYGLFSVAQSTIDEFNNALAVRSIGGVQASFSIFRRDGELYKEEMSAEDKKRQLDSLKELIDWLQKKSTIRPVNLALRMNKEKE